MENEEFSSEILKSNENANRFPCKANEILTFRVPKRGQDHAQPYETNGKQGNGLAAGHRGHFFVQTTFLCAQKKCLIYVVQLT